MTSRLLGLSAAAVVVISFDCHLLACFGFGVGFGFGFVFPALLCPIIRFTIFMSFSRLPRDVFVLVVAPVCRFVVVVHMSLLFFAFGLRLPLGAQAAP